jgi:hypothetical protein
MDPSRGWSPSAAPQPPDLRAIAVHLLPVTKLNWASTDSLSEGIALAYGGQAFTS